MLHVLAFRWIGLAVGYLSVVQPYPFSATNSWTRWKWIYFHHLLQNTLFLRVHTPVSSILQRKKRYSCASFVASLTLSPSPQQSSSFLEIHIMRTEKPGSRKVVEWGSIVCQIIYFPRLCECARPRRQQHLSSLHTYLPCGYRQSSKNGTKRRSRPMLPSFAVQKKKSPAFRSICAVLLSDREIR